MKKGIEKCILRIAYENESVTLEDLEKIMNKYNIYLDCLNCDGYDINCPGHPGNPGYILTNSAS